MRSLNRWISPIGILILFSLLARTTALAAGDTPPECACDQAAAMNNDRLETIIRKFDANAEGVSGFWRFSVAGRELLVITDETANRMRIISGVAEVKDIDAERMSRMMQANFDSALDARYAVAKGVLWSAFLHPLATLTDEDFVSGVAQVVNLADTYGSTYSSGALTFGGGDSDGLIKELLERADSI